MANAFGRPPTMANAQGAPEAESTAVASRAESPMYRASGLEGSGGSSESAEHDAPHDTVGVIALDSEGHLAAATSTSGWPYKAPGRVGDSPVVGAGIIRCHVFAVESLEARMYPLRAHPCLTRRSPRTVAAENH